MALSNEMTAADIAAVTDSYRNSGWGGNGLEWIIVLFLFAALGGNGFGGGYGGNGGFYGDMQRGFDQSATMAGINTLQGTVNNGFASAEVAGCNRAMDAMQTAYTNQIASMNQSFANQQALDSRLFSIDSALQNCCCENRASIADLKYTVATEACADRNAISEALRDVLTANTASTQRILDQMCQDKIDAKNEQIQRLENELNMANLKASQTAQTAQLLADNNRQTAVLEDYLNPVARPAYVVQNPNCCAPYNNGCGCGM